MEQQQFKIRMTVSTKLLLIISFLLATPILFLNLSAIRLFRQDKKAYVYDSQATAAVLAGREFVSYLDNSLGTIKLILGTVDLNKTFNEQSKNNIHFYLDNQHSIVGVDVYTIQSQAIKDNTSLSPQLLYQHFLPNQEIKPLESTIFAEHNKELSSKGFFFETIIPEKDTQNPILVIVFADTNRAPSPKGFIPLGVGYLSLKHFLEGSTNSFNKFLLAAQDGTLLFHSETSTLLKKKNILQDPIFQAAWTSNFKSGAREYISPEGILTLGSFYKPGLDLVALSQIEYAKAMQATYTLTEKFVVLGIAALGIMIVLGLIFSKRLTAPLKRLFKATAEVSSGNFNVDLPVSSTDEIGALTNSFIAMSRKISDLVKEMVDKVRVDQELEIAKTVQQSLFPPTTIKDDQILLESHYQSATECGGDWWGYFKTGNKHTLIIADATGHGLPSALMTASARSCFSVIEKLASDSRFNLDPAEMLAVANRVVYDSAQGKIMMTCFACVLDFDEHMIYYSSAAHNPPWLFSKKDDGSFKMSSLICKGQRLGEQQEIKEAYETKHISFKEGDTLFLYTDGLIEGKNLKEEQYGKKQSRLILEENMNKDPGEIIKILMEDFMIHNSGKALDDDVTLAVTRILPR